MQPSAARGNETLLHHAALGGQGIACLPTWLIEADLQTGQLVTVLPDEVPLFAVYPSRKYLSAKVRTFLDFMAAKGRLS